MQNYGGSITSKCIKIKWLSEGSIILQLNKKPSKFCFLSCTNHHQTRMYLFPRLFGPAHFKCIQIINNPRSRYEILTTCQERHAIPCKNFCKLQEQKDRYSLQANSVNRQSAWLYFYNFTFIKEKHFKHLKILENHKKIKTSN